VPTRSGGPPAMAAASAAPAGAPAAAAPRPRVAVTRLHARVAAILPAARAELKAAVAGAGSASLASVTAAQVAGGSRGIPSLLWDVSSLDPAGGIRMRGRTIAEARAALPAPAPGEEPFVEAVLWLLLTGEVPSAADVEAVRADLAARAILPPAAAAAIDAFPRTMHPTTQLAAAVLAMQPGSAFAAAYAAGAGAKGAAGADDPAVGLWGAALSDALDIIARLPAAAAAIYRNTFHGGSPGLPADPAADYATNFARALGVPSASFPAALRLYLLLHADHEGGNVSAHATRLVGSALSDPYLAFAAALCGLAGPLHGRANQEVMEWLGGVRASLAAAGRRPTADAVADAARATLAAGRVVPGFGHAVLRVTDPRYLALREFCEARLPGDPLFAVVRAAGEGVPPVLRATGKVANPWPNVDAHSGVVLAHYGVTEASFYTVLFGVSRALGVLSQLVWDRALGLPLERPKSLTTRQLAAAGAAARAAAAAGEGGGAGRGPKL
jgi:citrate synthase